MIKKQQRLLSLDFLKGLAIIAVFLYHFGGGLLQFGYLGVDIFFVVSGYLLIKQIHNQFDESRFCYWTFILRKLIRLWPLIICSIIVALVAGYFLMLPDDFENLAESTIASSVFANNILQCITTKNYWDVVNLYKPLMHLWYVGVLMQMYLVLPPVYVLFIKATKNTKKGLLFGTISLTVFSFVLFLLPQFSTAWKFYFFPFRLFELTAGGMLVFWNPKVRFHKTISWISLAIMLFLLCSRNEIVSGSFMLVFTVIVTILFVASTIEEDYRGIRGIIFKLGSSIGRCSYSIYIWHQVIIAFVFYSLFPRQNITAFFVVVGLTIVFSFLSYQLFEKRLTKVIGNKRHEAFAIGLAFVFSLIICLFSFALYHNAGVVRDVPELDIYRNDTHRGMHSEYCDRPYSWDRQFINDNRIKVLVLGNSFGRDWANILYEWDINKQLDIVYMYYTDKGFIDNIEKAKAADFVFYAEGPGYDSIPSVILETIKQEKLYVVGNKNYGESNGIIYAKRFSGDYYKQCVLISDELISNNARDSALFGDHYIDMMGPIMIDKNHAEVFTYENKFISQDCRHLTQAGAQFYSRILNIGRIFSR